MSNSFKLFFKELFSGIYWWISLLLFLSDYFFKPYLLEKIKSYLGKGVIKYIMSRELIFIIIIVLLFIATFRAYHRLRMVRLNELYRYLPEANRDRIFKIFYDLVEDGEFLKNAGTERRQKWDEEVLKQIKENCDGGFVFRYLVNTNRRGGVFSPLDDKDYDIALTIIKDLLRDNFNLHVNF